MSRIVTHCFSSQCHTGPTLEWTVISALTRDLHAKSEVLQGEQVLLATACHGSMCRMPLWESPLFFVAVMRNTMACEQQALRTLGPWCVTFHMKIFNESI